MRLMKAASVAVATTVTLTGMMVAAAPAFAFTPVSELQDVKRNHWAYNAIQALVEKYQVMEGFPDKTFRGQRPVTRYEFAAALAKVMAKIEEMQTGQAPTTSNGHRPEVGADDLKTIAALQTEFRRELAELKGRTDNLEERVAKLERAKISGSVTLMYRDRLAVDSATVANLPENAAGATTGSSPFADAFNVNDAMPVRVKSNLGIHGSIVPGATYHANLHIDEMGYGAAAGRSSVAGGHRGYEGLLGSPVFIEDSFVALGSWPSAHENAEMDKGDGDGKMLFAAGLMNFKHFITPGTRIKNHFGNVGWMGRGYGMLGFGGNFVNGASGASLPRYWGSGFDVSAVDPDSADYNKLSSPSIALGAGWGPVSLAIGTNAGSFYADRSQALQDLGVAGRPATILTGAAVTNNAVRSDAILGTQQSGLATGQVGVADLLNLPSQYNDGYSVASLDLDFGKPVGNDAFPVRINASLGQFNNDGLFGFGSNRSNLSFDIDLGGDASGLSIQGNKGFLQPDKATVGYFANDIGGSGFDLGLGANAAGRDLLIGNLGGLLDANAAVYVGLPTFDGFLPKIVAGARQGLANAALKGIGTTPAAGGPLGNSGFTVSATYANIANSGFGLRAEYSSLLRSEIWNFAAVTHDLGIFSTYRF